MEPAAVLDYDPRRPETLADPYPALERLRDEDPVHWSGALQSWVVTRYSDVKLALSDSRLSSDRISPFLEHQANRGREEARELGEQVGLWAVFTDPPTHTRLRGLLNRAFTTHAVERLRPRVQAIVDELLDAVRERGTMDVIRDLASPLPVTVIAELLGVPAEARERLKAWSDELATFVGSAVATEDKYSRARLGLAEMNDCFRAVITARRAVPRDDLVSALTAARDGEHRLGEEELVATCVMLLFAGHETTTNLIGNGALALARDRAAAAAWRRAPALTSTAVEELLRFDGPGQAMVRIVREDLELGGRRLRQGDRVFVMVNAANRDPRQFADPDRLDLARADNRHLAFGAGAHFCLGAPLARLEAQIAFPALLRRCGDLALAGDRLDWIDSLVFRGVRALPVTFRPG